MIKRNFYMYYKEYFELIKQSKTTTLGVMFCETNTTFDIANRLNEKQNKMK